MRKILLGNTLDVFRLWLLGREYEIAAGEEDFGELKTIFRVIIGREPKE